VEIGTGPKVRIFTPLDRSHAGPTGFIPASPESPYPLFGDGLHPGQGISPIRRSRCKFLHTVALVRRWLIHAGKYAVGAVRFRDISSGPVGSLFHPPREFEKLGMGNGICSCSRLSWRREKSFGRS